ncbi:DUF3108 domain-containing protein [Ferrimonas pelagia]|uniref:DUF3108 domain-containing protein n=1 Tax=Ferrimonas pelagia TaxID=1177826 RepID=A0ABP9FJX0_9GAMM
MYPRLLAAISAALLFLLTPVSAEPPAPYQAQYRAFASGLPCGQGEIELKRLSPGQYQYSASGKICSMGPRASHQSLFTYDDRKILPQRYETVLDGVWRDRHLAGIQQEGVFVQTLNGEPLPLELPFHPAQWEPTLLIHQLGLARSSVQLSYTWGEETRDYLFEYLGEETLETKLGQLKTHKFEQDHPHKQRVAQFWFAPQLNDALVQVKVSRLGIPWLTVELSAYQAAP